LVYAMRIIVYIKRYGLKALWLVSLSLVMMLPLSCFEDDMGEIISTENRMVEEVSDSPVPGNFGVITNGGVTNNSIQITWTKAVDNDTPQADLEYLVVRSGLNNIGNVSKALENGTVVQAWTADISSALAAGLSPATTYYFNVVVRDSLGNMSAYNVVSIATSGGVAYLFSTGARQGNLMGRENVDALCGSTMESDYGYLNCTQVRAFISLSVDDSLANMPYRYGIPLDAEIRGPTDVLIADGWLDLFDHEEDSLYSSLADAEVSGRDWWSASESDGSYVADDRYNCDGYTSNSDSLEGWGGDSHYTDYQWLTNEMGGGEHMCSERLHLLCVCWGTAGITY
jgi:hypothetical protein